jgi:membrane-associated phospholipid phosphatase
VTEKRIAMYASAICLTLIIISYLFWDIPIAKYCQTLSPGIKNIAEFVTSFGIATWYIVASIIFYLFFRFIYKNDINASRALFIFLSLGITGIFINIVKWIAGRHRPIDLFNHGYWGFDYFRGVGYELASFPSGHAQTAFTFAAALTILFPRWGIPLFVFAGAVGITRVILTAHYLSDVIAGAGIGIICTLVIKYYFDKYKIQLSKVKE